MTSTEVNFSLAMAAIARARRHLRAARILALFWMYDQAYAHVVLAIEECAVHQIRRDVVDGNATFEKADADRLGLTLVDEAILTRHPKKQASFANTTGAVASIAVMLGMLLAVSSALPEPKRKGQSAGALAFLGLTLMSAGAGLVMPDAESWERLKQGAFYSGPRRIGDPPPVPPTRKDFKRLYSPAKSWILGASSNAQRWKLPARTNDHPAVSPKV